MGDFDGVHLGHRALIAQAKKMARQDGRKLVVMTFEPQPREYFGMDQGRLTPLRAKARLLAELGVDALFALRFDDALAAYMLANRYDTPQVSRWTWLLGVGQAYVVLDRSEDALPWLQRSIAVTPGTGRTHFLLAAAYQRLGRFDEARAAVAAGMKLRPGTTAANVSLPKKNASATYLERGKEINDLLIAAGMPRGDAQASATQ